MTKWHDISIDTTGADGLAEGTGDLNIVQGGIVACIDVNYHASMPATCDVTISEVKPSGNLRTLLTLSNTATDVSRIVQEPTYTSANALTGNYMLPVVGSTLRIAVAGANALTAGVVVSVLIV